MCAEGYAMYTKHTGHYTIADGSSLEYDAYYPADPRADRASVVLFFGGGYVRGLKEHMEDVADQLASYGFIAFAPDYRVFNRQGVSPYECAKDGCYFYKHLLDNAEFIGIDPERVFLSGGSAGGGVALNTAIGFRRPAGLVLFNPAYTVSDARDEKIKPLLEGRPQIYPDRCDGYSDMFMIDPAQRVKYLNGPFSPCIVFHGSEDVMVSPEGVTQFAEDLKKLGGICELHMFPSQKHGFYHKDRNAKLHVETCRLAAEFMDRILKG